MNAATIVAEPKIERTEVTRPATPIVSNCSLDIVGITMVTSAPKGT